LNLPGLLSSVIAVILYTPNYPQKSCDVKLLTEQHPNLRNIPYYISRAVLSAGFALLVFKLTWQAAVFGLVMFGLFLLYLHSGWYRIDLSQPLFPLRRDDRGVAIQRKALIAAIVVGLLAYLTLTQFTWAAELAGAGGSLALAAGMMVYFISQFMFHLKT